ncbi:MAG: FadR family transcriptional regulator [Alphaproteobacteria bacterium]|nr:FadR family transcriptional regulator [Alphaproteobacteria bacterium]
MSRLVFDQIIAEIREGRLRPGDRLPSEHELVAMFEVGRSSVREALRGLVTLGLIETRPGRGAVVALQADSPLAALRRDVDLEQLSRRALLDLLEVRDALESRAAALAAERATAEDIERLRRCHGAVERDVAAGRSYFRTNTDFHRAVASAARNPVLADSIRLLIGQVRAYRERLMRELPAMPEQDVREHGALVDAIAAHDAERARRAMSRHIRSFAALLTGHGGRDAA